MCTGTHSEYGSIRSPALHGTSSGPGLVRWGGRRPPLVTHFQAFRYPHHSSRRLALDVELVYADPAVKVGRVLKDDLELRDLRMKDRRTWAHEQHMDDTKTVCF